MMPVKQGARFDPGAPDLRVDPYPMYAHYREHDPVHWGLSSLAGYDGAWYLFRHADAVSVLRDPRFGKARKTVTFADGDQPAAPAAPAAPAVPAAARTFFGTARRWLVHRDPPDHTRLRRLLQPHFTPAAVQRYRPRIAAIADELVTGLAERGSGELVTELAYPLPVRVIAELLELPKEGRDLLVDCSRSWQAVDVLTTDETWQRAGAAIGAAREYLADLVAERRRAPGEDLVSVLIHGLESGAVADEDELLANIMFLFVAGAGFQTTTGLIGSALHLLLRHPDQRAALTADWELLPGTVEEALRYEPPVQTTNRIAREHVELGGRSIRPGDSVLAVFASANRDPAVFDRPDRFDIHRSRQGNHSFGVGIHFCLGGPLALVEAEVAVRAVLERFPTLTEDGPASWNPMVSLRVLRELPVRVAGPAS